MKTKTTTLLLAAMTVIAAGCGSDDATTDLGTSQPTVPEVPGAAAGAAITVNVGVGAMETRAGHSSSNLPDKFIFNFDDTDGNSYKDVTMTLDANTGKYQPSETMTWGTESRTATIYAWTEPVAVSTATCHQIVSVADDQSTEENIRRSDFLWASTKLGENIKVNGDALDITLQHAFSKIDIRCHLGEEITSRYPDARVCKVVIGGVYRGGPFNFSNGTPVDHNESLTDKGTVTAYLNEPEDGTVDVTAEAIMVPQYFDDGRATLTVTLINNDKEKEMPSVEIPTGRFAGSYRYTMTVNIGYDSVTVGEVTAQPWTEGSGWTIETE